MPSASAAGTKRAKPRRAEPRARAAASRPAAALIVGAGLLSGPGLQAQLAGFPPAQQVDVLELLGPAPAAAPAPDAGPAPAGLSAAERAARLKAHPLHGERFFVRGVHGDPTASKTIYVVPQFHRSATSPLAWSSLGKAIADVQTNIDALTTTLATAEGVTCVGTEGSPAERISESFELKRLAYWREDLAHAEARARKALAGEGRERADDLETLRVVLEGALKERAAVLDGVGAAQARLEARASGPGIDRFGVEDAELNRRAVALAQRRDRLDRELAALEPASVDEVQSAIGRMWVAEYPLYRESTVGPLLESLAVLDKERLHLMKAGAHYPARVLGHYLALVRRVAEDTVRPEEVEATFAHYRAVAERLADAGPEREPATRKLGRAEKRKKRRLERRRAALTKRYRALAHDQRDRVAARRVLERVNRPEHEACALVFGQGHKEGVVGALVKLGGESGLGPVGVVVVEPYEL